MRTPAHIRNAQDFAAAYGVSRETTDRLGLYADLLRHWQKSVNLVAPSTLDDVWHRHFADSAQVMPLAHAYPGTWIDIGSGGGFPALVTAILSLDPAFAPPPGAPQRRFVLVESIAKKCAFLSEVARRTGVAQVVDILSVRVETLPTRANLAPPAVISARALAALDKLLALSAPLFGPSTIGLFLKGQGAETEIAEARKAWEFEVDLVPSRTEPAGRIVVVRKLAPNV